MQYAWYGVCLSLDADILIHPLSCAWPIGRGCSVSLSLRLGPFGLTEVGNWCVTPACGKSSIELGMEASGYRVRRKRGTVLTFQRHDPVEYR